MKPEELPPARNHLEALSTGLYGPDWVTRKPPTGGTSPKQLRGPGREVEAGQGVCRVPERKRRACRGQLAGARRRPRPATCRGTTLRRPAGSPPAADNTSWTSRRGGVLRSAPCKGRSRDACRAQCPLPVPTPPRPPARPGARCPVRSAGPAPRRRQVAHAFSRGVASCTTPRLQRTKMDSVAETASWAPAAYTPVRPARAHPEDARAPRAGSAPLPASPGSAPQGDPDPGSCPGAGGGRGLTGPAGGGMQARPRLD